MLLDRSPSRAALALLAGLAAVCLSACDKDPGPAPGPSGGADGATPPALDLAQAPNVLLISIDTLRADHLSAYGYGRETSPRIDALAAEGALFEHCASSSSWTLPSHAALLTGLSDMVHGCTDTDKPLAPGRTTLAERLKAVGYTTGGFWSGPYLHPAFGLGQGFDTWVDCTSYAAKNDEMVAKGETLEGAAVWKRADDDITSPRVLERATAWLDQHAGERFFLFTHWWDCHFDFIPPPPYDTKFDPDYEGTQTGRNFFFDPAVNPSMDPRDLQHLIALYDGEIAWTDHHIGLLLDALEKHGLTGNTLVVLTSDHGTAFFEHGQKAHRNGLFDELTHVPLIVRFPGRVPPRTRVPQQVRGIDVTPTILDLVGLPHPPDVMGRSLAPAFDGTLPDSPEPAVSELYTLGQSLRSYRRLDRKIIMVWTDPQHPRSLVFDLAHDPGEQHPLPSADLPVSKAALRDREEGFAWLKRWQAALPVDRATTEVPTGVLRQLQQFGYVGGKEGR